MLSWESTILSFSKSALTSTCKSGRLKLGSGADTVLSSVILCSKKWSNYLYFTNHRAEKCSTAVCQYSVVLHVVHNVTQRLPIQQLCWPGPTAGGGLKIGEKLFLASLKLNFRKFEFFLSMWLSNSGVRGFIKHWHCLHFQLNPKSHSPVFASWAQRPLQVDCGYCCHPSVSNLSPLPPPPSYRSNDDTWKAEGGFCGADSESTMTHWSTGSSLRSSSCSRDDRSGQDGEREVPQSQGESQPWAGDGQRSIHNVWMITFTSTSSSPVKGKDLQWISSIILFHFFRVHPDYQRWPSCFLHLSSQSSCAFALTPAPVLSSFLPLV